MRKAQERSLEIFQKKVKMGRKYCPLPIEPKTSVTFYLKITVEKKWELRF